MPGIPEAATRTHSTEYFAFHCTSYALGALHALGDAPGYPLAFVETLRSRRDLEEWLSRRDWSSPWMEGNNVVNLASFNGVLAKGAADWAHERLVDLAEWHDRHQNPTTGFWHACDATSRTALYKAMAGAAHNLHIYYRLEREVQRPTVIVESCLRLGYMGIRSACVDIDFVDILVNLRRYGHCLEEIDRILGKYLLKLLQVQGLDGGFCDTYVTPSNCYGYVTPARLSRPGRRGSAWRRSAFTSSRESKRGGNGEKGSGRVTTTHSPTCPSESLPRSRPASATSTTSTRSSSTRPGRE
jgi:hypothetical protein